VLPNGGSLPAEVWQRRHRALAGLLWLHVAALPAYALLRGYELGHSLAEAAPVLVLAILGRIAAGRSARLRGALVAAGLMTCSAVVVHLSGGAIEAHFHFFVMLSLLLLYEDWIPFLLAMAYVVGHHGLVGAIAPETVYNHASGQAHPWRWAAVHGIFVGAASIANVVSWRLNEDVRRETKEADEAQLAKVEEQLLQSQKMEAVGQLAGGVAHDFNNLLTVISGYGELALNHLNDGERARADIEEMRKAAARAGSLTQQLLAFSRRQVLRPAVLDLNAVVAETETMLRRLIGEDVVVATALDPRLGRVEADPVQIQQVLVNLALNARDAMPDGGRLTIETANAELDETAARTAGEVAPGSYVMLTLTDTGCGMDVETQARAFEPFFTTKGPAKGTGLGLSTVYGIVKQSGGCVAVASEPGEGAVLRVFLPRSDEPLDEPDAHLAVDGEGGAERILLVEDEDVVRSLVREILEEQGYVITETADPEEAVSLYEEEGPFDLLLTDVVMPKLNGRQLAERLSSATPELRVLYMSGYTSHAIIERGVLDAETAFLQKPFTSAELTLRVRDVLDGTLRGAPAATARS
jgi:signal transduction histidine kinase/CheY-like chemotaxis protein